MIDVLKEIELLEQIREAAEDGDLEKVTELCRDKIHDNLKAVRDFERAYAKDSFVADIRRQDAKAAN
tara:strand:+ start:262 stop:462 length:201 start_codon:yes stop_codon:yes gene_type:complete